MTEENQAVVENEMEEEDRLQINIDQKLFNKYEQTGITTIENSLNDHLSFNTTKSNVLVPHSAGKWQKKRFHKDNIPIVERLANFLMFKARNAGKKTLAINTVMEAFDIIEKRAKKNPIQVLIDAIYQGSAREDSCRVGSGGAVKRQAVDVSPARRVSQALQQICIGARKAAFRKRKSFPKLLAEEIQLCSENNMQSFAVKKRDDIEKQAKANR